MNINDIAQRINYVVVMMMENRSFDHLYGYFPGAVETPYGFCTGSNQYNLQNPAEQSGTPQGPVQVTVSNQRAFNPGHSFSPMMTDLFGPGTQGCLNGAAQPPPPPYFPTQTMCGFISTNHTSDVMTAFEANQLQVLYPLAENFVLCANWFCDSPAETVPNRHFVHAGTNMGWNDTNPVWPAHPNQILPGEAPDIYHAKTLYQSLDEIAGSGINWAMYGFKNFTSRNGTTACSYDSDMYAYTNTTTEPDENARYQAGHRDIGCLESDIANGNLPFYTFIMPSLNYPSDANGNSMHPASDVQYGENYVAHVYNILCSSKIWNETLFIVTFDENGGLYDHIFPPTTVPPDSITYPPSTPQSPLFDYRLLGPRIPTLLVSPWLQNSGVGLPNSIDLNQYQNTSIPRFVQDLFAAKCGGGGQTPFLTQRDLYAPSFAASKFWRSALPGGLPPTITPYPPSGGNSWNWYYPLAKEPSCEGGDGATLLPAPPAGEEPPAKDAVDLVWQYVIHLPGHPDSGKGVARTFASRRELWEYLQERNAAARRYVG